MVASGRVDGVESDVDVAVGSASVDGEGSWCCGREGYEHGKCERDDGEMHLGFLVGLFEFVLRKLMEVLDVGDLCEWADGL